MHSFVFVALLVWAQGSPMTLAEVEADAVANNPEIRSFQQQVRVAESRLGSAAAVDDPQLGYRAWGTPAYPATRGAPRSSETGVPAGIQRKASYASSTTASNGPLETTTHPPGEVGAANALQTFLPPHRIHIMSIADVRLTSVEQERIREAVVEISARFGVRWKRVSLFGSRTDRSARGGDIDLYIEIEGALSGDVDVFVRALRLRLQDHLGEQKIDLVIDDGLKDLGAFGEIVRRTKVDLWTAA